MWSDVIINPGSFCATNSAARFSCLQSGWPLMALIVFQHFQVDHVLYIPPDTKLWPSFDTGWVLPEVVQFHPFFCPASHVYHVRVQALSYIFSNLFLPFNQNGDSWTGAGLHAAPRANSGQFTWNPCIQFFDFAYFSQTDAKYLYALCQTSQPVRVRYGSVSTQVDKCSLSMRMRMGRPLLGWSWEFNLPCLKLS